MLTAVVTVWGICKIVGLVLLGILGLLLLLLLLVLLVPVRYRIEGSYKEKPWGEVRVSWLLRLLSVKAEYKEKLTAVVRVLGIRVFRFEKTFGKDGEASETEEASDAGAASGAEETTETEAASDAAETSAAEKSEVTATSAAEVEPEVIETDVVEVEVEVTETDAVEAEAKLPEVPQEHKKASRERKKASRGASRPKKKRRVFSFRQICDKLKNKIQSLRTKIRELKDKKERLMAFINDEANRKTFHLALRQVRKLIRHLLPTKASGRVRFGFEDPSTTGQVLVYISPFYGLYGDKLELIPVFGEKAMEGEGTVKGRIRLGTVLWIGGRMLLDKNCRRLLKKLLQS